MTKKRIFYTDPMWVLDEQGSVDPSRAGIEREIYGDDCELIFGLRSGASFELAGPRFEAALAEADAVVIYRATITEALIPALKQRCRVVARQGVGFDNLNAPLLREAGIFGFNVPDYCVDEVSTHTIGMAIALERHLCHHDREIKAGRWSIFAGGRPRRMAELTLGVIGFGRIGRATCAKARPLVREILAYDPHVHGDLMLGYGARKRETLPALLADADLVVLHAELNAETRHIINADAVAAMQPGATLLNTARGGLVDSKAVLDGLRRGHLRGYGSDVFSPEDPNHDPINRELVRLPNVVVTCHRAFLSAESEYSQRQRVAEEVRRVIVDDHPPRFGRLA